MAKGIIAPEAKSEQESVTLKSIDIQDGLQQAVWTGALSGWIEVARGLIWQLAHAASYDDELAKRLKKHDIVVDTARWDREESTALTMLLASQVGRIREAMTLAEEIQNA